MVGADAACLEVNSLIQETSFVSRTKDRAGEYRHCLMYLLSVPTSFTPQTCVVSIKMSSKTMCFVLNVSLNRTPSNKYILVMMKGFRIELDMFNHLFINRQGHGGGPRSMSDLAE